jgi:hypothetical protein
MSLTKEEYKALPKAIQESFLDMCCELSPENLSCDGELSMTRVRQKYAGIMKRWKALEKKIGKSFPYEEAEMIVYDIE